MLSTSQLPTPPPFFINPHEKKKITLIIGSIGGLWIFSVGFRKQGVDRSEKLAARVRKFCCQIFIAVIISGGFMSLHNIKIVAKHVQSYGVDYVARHLGFSPEYVKLAIAGDEYAADDVFRTYLDKPLNVRSGRPRSTLTLEERHKLLDLIGDSWLLALHSIGLPEACINKALLGREINLPSLQTLRDKLGDK